MLPIVSTVSVASVTGQVAERIKASEAYIADTPHKNYSGLRLAWNENPSKSPYIQEYLANDPLSGANHYLEEGQVELKEAIAQRHGVAPTEILCGNGSSELVKHVVETFLSDRDKPRQCLISQYAYPAYEKEIKIHQADLVKVPALHYQHDLKAILEQVNAQTGLILLVNPSNPSGTYLSPEEIADFMRRLHATPYGKKIPVVIDEAYIHFSHPESQDASIDLFKTTQDGQRVYDNLMILRTFSKAHGLAGLRVGYMIVSEPLQKQLHKLTTVCNVNLVAHEIAKLAIKDEKGFINQVYDLNKKARDFLCKHLDALGIRHPKSQASFVLLNMAELAPQVPAIRQRLEKEDNIAVRIVKEKGEPYHLRVSIGTIGDMQAFISAFKKILNPHRCEQTQALTVSRPLHEHTAIAEMAQA